MTMHHPARGIRPHGDSIQCHRTWHTTQEATASDPVAGMAARHPPQNVYPTANDGIYI